MAAYGDGIAFGDSVIQCGQASRVAFGSDDLECRAIIEPVKPVNVIPMVMGQKHSG